MHSYLKTILGSQLARFVLPTLLLALCGTGTFITAQLLTFGEQIHLETDRIEFAGWDYGKKLEQLDRRLEQLHGAAPERFPRGGYLTASTVANAGRRDEIFDALQAAGGTAFVVDVKGSFVYFNPSTAPLMTEYGLHHPLYDLPALVQTAHDRGLYVIARFIVAKDPVLSGNHRDLRIQNPKSGQRIGETWVDPGNPTVLEYNRQILSDVIRAGVDEVNFDYIRFPTEWSPQQIGLTREEKTAKVEAFLRMARETIDAEAPDVRLGISTYAIIGWGYDVNVSVLGQDVVQLAPLVDVISPMAYPATFAMGAYYDPSRHPVSRMYYLVHRTLTGYADALGPEHARKIRPWIQGYGITVKNAADQIKAVYDAGACGFTFWNANNNYAPAFAAMAQQPAPEHCVLTGV